MTRCLLSLLLLLGLLAESAAQARLRTDFSPRRYVGNPIIELVEGEWFESQLFDFAVFPDPANSANLVMYASGMAAPVEVGQISIGRLTSTVANPYAWTDQGVVLSPGASGQWDEFQIRLGSCFYVSGTYYLYYTGINNAGIGKIGLATSTDGSTFTKHASNPLVTADGNGSDDGTHVSEPAVIRRSGSSWEMIYSYRDDPTSILPGYRAATSSDGVTWTKTGGGDVLTTAPLYGEFHQIITIGGDDYLFFEAGNTTTPFRIFGAKRNGTTGPFTRLALNPVLAESGTVSAFDRYHVATPFVVEIGGRWLLYYCGAIDHDQPYGTNHWPVGVAEWTLREISSAISRGR